MDGILIASKLVDEAKKEKKRSFIVQSRFLKSLRVCELDLSRVCGWDNGVPSEVERMDYGMFTNFIYVRAGEWEPYSRVPDDSEAGMLKYDDPLSPFHFLLAAEGLNLMMPKLVWEILNDTNLAMVALNL